MTKTIESQIETFDDGSTITTDSETGNRTIVGSLAHKEYFKRLEAERITSQTDYAVMAFCRDVDGTRKAELIRKRTSPELVETFGEFSYEVWSSDDPKNVTMCASYAKAKKAFDCACLYGTNGWGV